MDVSGRVLHLRPDRIGWFVLEKAKSRMMKQKAELFRFRSLPGLVRLDHSCTFRMKQVCVVVVVQVLYLGFLWTGRINSYLLPLCEICYVNGVCVRG